MIQLLLLLLLAPLTYEQVYEQAKTTGVMVILVEGENCPACKVQENNLNIIKVSFHKTQDAARFGDMPKLRPLTLFYYREGKEWKLKLVMGSIDVDKLRDVFKRISNKDFFE